jgi:hypothetical protein
MTDTTNTPTVAPNRIAEMSNKSDLFGTIINLTEGKNKENKRRFFLACVYTALNDNELHAKSRKSSEIE